MPHVYGIEHILYLAAVAILFALGLTLIHRYVRTDRQIEITIRLLAGVLLAAIVWNRLAVAIQRDGFAEILPSTFCGSSSLALSLTVLTLRKDHPVFHCVAYIGMLGGLLTIFYPDFIGQADSIWFSMTISGLVHHTVMVFLVLTMVMTGWLKPTIRKWHDLPLGLAVYMCYGLFLITVLGYSNAMYIYEPVVDGTPLDWFVLGMIFLPVHAVFLLAWGRLVRPKTVRV
jgi:hypothetical protein